MRVRIVEVVPVMMVVEKVVMERGASGMGDRT